MTTLETELSMKRRDFAFLRAAFEHVGWEIDDEVESITTDEGYDHELRTRVRIRLPLAVVAKAPDLHEITGEPMDHPHRIRVVA